MLQFCQSQTCSNEILYDFLTLLLIIFFSKKISYLKINGIGLLVFFIVFLKLFLLSENNPLQWPATANIAISQKILNTQNFNNDLSVIAGLDSPKYILSFILSKVSHFFGIDIIYAYYLLKIVIIIFMPLFISFSLYKLTTDKEKILYIKSNILRNFLIIFICVGIFSRLSKLFYNGWVSFLNYNILYVPTEQSMALLLGFCGLFFLTYFRSKVSLIFFALSTLIHPVIGISNYLIKIILCLNRKIIFKPFLKKELFFFTISICIPILLIGFIWNENIINVSEFIEIYIVQRHPHHYLVSYYFNYFSLITLVFILVLLVINFKKNKELLFFSLIIFFSISLPTLIQFIFIEIIPTKFFAKLGISRFGIFTYMLIFIFTVITFQKNITAIMIKFSDLIFIQNFNKKFVYLNLDKSFYLILPIFFIFLLYKTLAMNYDKINDEISLSKKILSFNLNNDKTIQFSKKIVGQLNVTTQIRILSKTNVFYDAFFPFNENYILSWFDRHKKINSFTDEKDLICYLKRKKVDFYITGHDINFKSIYDNNKYQLISILDFGCNN